MKFSLTILLLLTSSGLMAVGSDPVPVPVPSPTQPVPSVVVEEEGAGSGNGEVEVDSDQSLERLRRSNLMAQILYDELRLKLRGDQTKPSTQSRRVASASMMRKRRSTTPLRDLLQSLAANSEGDTLINNEIEHNNEVVDELETEIRTLERRLIKRSLMAMILKDTLKQRLEEENKPGRHRDITWGKATRNYGARIASHGQNMANLLPHLAEAVSEAAEDYEERHNPSAALKQAANELSHISISIKPKTGKSA